MSANSLVPCLQRRVVRTVAVFAVITGGTHRRAVFRLGNIVWGLLR